MSRLVPLSGDQRCSITAMERLVHGKSEIGFSLRVGGGLSTEPYLGARLNAFVRWNQVLPVVRGITELFRDQINCVRTVSGRD